MVEAEEEASDEEAVLSSMLAQQRLAADEATVCPADAYMQAQVHRVAASQAIISRIVLGMLKVRSHVILCVQEALVHAIWQKAHPNMSSTCSVDPARVPAFKLAVTFSSKACTAGWGGEHSCRHGCRGGAGHPGPAALCALRCPCGTCSRAGTAYLMRCAPCVDP